MTILDILIEEKNNLFFLKATSPAEKDYLESETSFETKSEALLCAELTAQVLLHAVDQINVWLDGERVKAFTKSSEM